MVYEIALAGVTAMDGDETVASSLQLLSRVAKPEPMTEIELDGVAVDLKRLRECATLAFHSVYVTWGSNNFDRCDQLEIAHSRDHALFSQWETTETELMLMVGSEDLSEDGELHFAALRIIVEPWLKAAHMLSSTLSSASEGLKTRLAKNSTEVDELFSDFATKLDVMLAKRHAALMLPIVSGMLGRATSVPPISISGGDLRGLEAPSLLICSSYFEKLCMAALVAGKDNADRLADFRETRARYRIAVKGLAEQLRDPNKLRRVWQCRSEDPGKYLLQCHAGEAPIVGERSVWGFGGGLGKFREASRKAPRVHLVSRHQHSQDRDQEYEHRGLRREAVPEEEFHVFA